MYPVLRLVRIYQAPITGTALVLGGVAGGIYSPTTLTGLFLSGLFLHFFFSASNDIMDVDEDRKRGSLRNHPLAAGEITPRKANTVAFLSLLAAALIFTSLSLYAGTVSAPLVFFLMGVVLLSSYNVVNKMLPGTEFLLMLGFISLSLSGSALGGFPDPLLAVLISLLLGFHLLVLVTVFNGVWEAKDRVEGEKALLSFILGARKRGNRFLSSPLFLIYSLAVQGVLLLLLLLPFTLGDLPYWRGQLALVFLLYLGGMLFAYRVITAPIYDENVIARSGVYYYITIGTALPMLFAAVHPGIMLLALLPFLEVAAAKRLLGVPAMAPTMAVKVKTYTRAAAQGRQAGGRRTGPTGGKDRKAAGNTRSGGEWP